MAAAQFIVGQSLHLLKDLRAPKSQAAGLYTVVRIMPNDGREPSYRVKHDAEVFERVVAESQLAETERKTDEPVQIGSQNG
jgi:hypothetical protein